MTQKDTPSWRSATNSDWSTIRHRSGSSEREAPDSKRSCRKGKTGVKAHPLFAATLTRSPDSLYSRTSARLPAPLASKRRSDSSGSENWTSYSLSTSDSSTQPSPVDYGVSNGLADGLVDEMKDIRTRDLTARVLSRVSSFAGQPSPEKAEAGEDAGQDQLQDHGSHPPGLIGMCIVALNSIWGAEESRNMSLLVFIRELLRRSQTSQSTLRIALLYLHKGRRILRNAINGPFSSSKGANSLKCPRRTFLSSLVVASKFLQDRTYSTRAWSAICGLSMAEINRNEMAFLQMCDYQLHVSADEFESWSNKLADLARLGVKIENDTCVKQAVTSATTTATMLTPDLNPKLVSLPPATSHRNLKLAAAARVPALAIRKCKQPEFAVALHSPVMACA